MNLDRAERNEKARNVAAEISSLVNGSNRSAMDLALLSMQDHPTLLQGKMRFCIAFIELMSQRKGDLRTEASENLARKIIESTDDVDRILPLI